GRTRCRARRRGRARGAGALADRGRPGHRARRAHRGADDLRVRLPLRALRRRLPRRRLAVVNAAGPVPVAILGPTAAGKSALALDLAERLGGEIVNCDAMQLYRGMDIGTAKLPVAERRGIAHHQLDVLEVTDTAPVRSEDR